MVYRRQGPFNKATLTTNPTDSSCSRGRDAVVVETMCFVCVGVFAAFLQSVVAFEVFSKPYILVSCIAGCLILVNADPARRVIMPSHIVVSAC